MQLLCCLHTELSPFLFKKALPTYIYHLFYTLCQIILNIYINDKALAYSCQQACNTKLPKK